MQWRLWVLSADAITLPDGRRAVCLWCRDENRKVYVVIDKNYTQYFFILPKSDDVVDKIIEKLANLRIDGVDPIYSVVKERKRYIGKERTVIRVDVEDRFLEKVKDIVKQWEEVEGKKEVDIPIDRKYLVDKKISPLDWIIVEGKEIPNYFGFRNVDHIIEAHSIKRTDEYNKDVKVLAFDIEVAARGIGDPKVDPIVSIALYGKDYKKVITTGDVDLPYVEKARNEYELIRKFFDELEKYDPDIIVGYNSDDFDLRYIYERAKHLGIEIRLRDGSAFRPFGRKDRAQFKFPLIQHVDLYTFISNILGSTLKSEELSLDAVAKEVLGEGKVDLGELAGEAWITGRHEEVIVYNLKDAELTYRLFEEFGPLIIELARAVGQPIDAVSRMTAGQIVEWYLIRRTRDFNEIAPNRPRPEVVEERRRITYAGAFVYQPKPGLYENIVVMDFRSLYPTIIISYNISPDTLMCNHEECKSNGINVIIGGREMYVWFCKKVKGFIPAVLKDLFERRVEYKKKMKQYPKDSEEYKTYYARQYALKLIINSHYGYLGYPNSRWYSIECAAAVTAFGRKHIKEVISEAEKFGFKVIYGDTDSLFLQAESKEKALEFLEYINKKLPKPMELELEDFYVRGIFIAKKGEASGAKKKYALISEKGEIKLRGFEAVRRDWAPIAKEAQEKVLEIILKEGNVQKALDYIKKVIQDLKEHRVPINKLIIMEQLQKDLDEYKVDAPHVVAAKKYKQLGYPVRKGFLVKYVIVKGGGRLSDRVKIPEEVRQEEYDEDYYIERQVLPAVERIFDAVGVDKMQLRVVGSGQKSLLSFFGGD